jgi:hypothetical protein
MQTSRQNIPTRYQQQPNAWASVKLSWKTWFSSAKVKEDEWRQVKDDPVGAAKRSATIDDFVAKAFRSGGAS